MPLFLSQSFGQTALDLENPGPYGGFNTLDTITEYPATNTGTPTSDANPGSPTNFNQSYVPTNTYVEDMRNNGSRFFRYGNSDTPYDIFDATNLDTEKPGVDGGIPYDQIKDPTVYPVTTQAVDATTSGFNVISGSGASKYTQRYSAASPYFQ